MEAAKESLKASRLGLEELEVEEPEMKGSNLEAQFEEERSKLKGLVAKEGMTEQADLFGDDDHEARH